MIYFANPTRDANQAMLDGRLGFIDTPAQGNVRPPGVTWCADNGCFGKGYPGDAGWFDWLERNAHAAATCLFATAPDALCDHQRTYLRADPWLDRVRALGYPVAFVAQNGCRPNKLAWDRFDALFIGVDDEFKLGPHARELVTVARERGKWVHMGRVNSLKRSRYAEAIGCHSIDGTYITFAPDKNLPKVLGWMRDVNDQTTLWGAA